MTKRQEEKFNQKMESYRQGIIEDLKVGRDISAIICGYGFIYQEEYKKAYDWIMSNKLLGGKTKWQNKETWITVLMK